MKEFPADICRCSSFATRLRSARANGAHELLSVGLTIKNQEKEDCQTD
jgi:hypothetical protein